MSESCNTKQEKRSWKEYFRSRDFLKTLIGIVIGGVAGFLYYHYVGCTSGTCAIMSNPYMSVAFGGFFGYFLTNRPCAC